jgi:threonine dehydrogenase-like Zn-dependent dehydrogenase
MLAIAARTGSPHPGFVDAPQPPAPGPGEVLCRTLEIGVCGTDRDILESKQPLLPPGDDHLVLGHECLARVDEVGPGVRDFRQGDLVVPVVRRAVGVRTERVDLLPFGQYTERGIVREHGFALPWFVDRPEHLFPVAEKIASVAVFTEPLSIAEKAVNEALAVERGRLGEAAWSDPPPRVLVTGLGPIAFGAVLACRARDWPVTLYGRDADDTFRVQAARAFGAAYLPAARYDFDPADVEQDGFDLILECTGSDEVMVRSASALAARGVMAWLGSARVPKPKEVNVAQLMRHAVVRNHIHLGTVNAAPRDFADALSHLAQLHAAQPRELAAIFTDRVAPEEALWHYENRRPQGIKTVVVFGERT